MGNPLPVACVLLTLLLPGVWLLGRWLAARTASSAVVAVALAPGLGLTLWLLAVHWLSMATHSFLWGLVVGTILIGGAGYALNLRGIGAPRSTPIAGAVDLRWVLGSAALTTLLLAPAVLRFHFHDEFPITGHLSMATSIQNNLDYPPRHLSFPQFELRYHYAFDLLTAIFGTLFRLPTEHAIDAVTLLAWPYAWCVLCVIGQKLLGEKLGGRGGLLTAAMVLLGGGLPIYCQTSSWGSHAMLVMGACKVGSVAVNVPNISYFFQHPWGLGFPVGLCVILLHLEKGEDRPREMWRLGALMLALTLLSLCQVVLFLCLFGSLLVAELFVDGKLVLRRLAWTLPMLATTALLARSLHGFFAPAPWSVGFPLVLRDRVMTGAVGWWALWNLETFGLMLPLGIGGLVLLRRRGQALVFLVLVAGSLGVLNLLEYRASFDILKFATVTMLALSLPASVAIAALLQARPGRAAARLLGWGALAISLAPGVAYALTFAFTSGTYGDRRLDVSMEGAQAIAWLRREVRVGESVLVQDDRVRAYVALGGLPTPWVDGGTAGFAFPNGLLEANTRLVQHPGVDPGPYRRANVKWFVLDDAGSDRRFTDSDRRLAAALDQWVRAGQARVAIRFGSVRVVALVP